MKLKPTEANLQVEIIQCLRLAGVVVLENRSNGKRGAYLASKTGDKEAVGSPDLICAFPGGHVLWLELKRKGQLPTEQQVRWATELQNRHQWVAWVTSYRELVIAVGLKRQDGFWALKSCHDKLVDLLPKERRL